MTKKIVSIYIILVMCFFCLTFLTTKNVYAFDELEVNAKAFVLVDYHSGEILEEKNSKEHLEVASIVKLMTTLLTLEKLQKGEIELSDTLVASENASSMGGSQVFIDANGKYTVEEMLKSVIVASANDASVALAEFLAGSENNFVNLMNKKAKELEMNDTLYANATGLPAPNQYSCAFDTAKLLSKVIEFDIYHNYSTIWIDKLKHNSGRETEIVNTNKLVRYYQGCDGGKTGFTDEAGYCLASSVKRDNMRLISVVLGTNSKNDRFNESAKLFNFGFANFENKEIINKSTPVDEIDVLKSMQTKSFVYPQESFSCVVRKGMENKFDFIYNIDKDVVAPVYAGQKVGNVIITKNGEIIKEIDLVICEDIKQITYKEAIDKIIDKF